MLYDTHILDFSPPENGRIKFKARIEDITRGIVTIAHLDFPIEQRTKTWLIPKSAITRSITQTIGSQAPLFSVTQKISNILNED